MITRRETTKMLLGAIAAVAVPAAVHAAPREDWMAALSERLARATPPGSGKTLTLVRFEAEAGASEARMAAVVRMDWAPGIRSRRFEAVETDEREAFEALAGKIVRGFGIAASEGLA